MAEYRLEVPKAYGPFGRVMEDCTCADNATHQEALPPQMRMFGPNLGELRVWPQPMQFQNAVVVTCVRLRRARSDLHIPQLAAYACNSSTPVSMSCNNGKKTVSTVRTSIVKQRTLARRKSAGRKLWSRSQRVRVNQPKLNLGDLSRI